MSRPRPARSTVRHGMASCAKYGCTRPECRRAHRKASARSQMDRARGLAARVDAAAARNRIHRLLLTGMSIEDIAQRAGIGGSTVRALNRGAVTRIYRTTHDSILGIPVKKSPQAPSTRGYIDAVGARRRLQALAAIGWTRESIATRTGLSARTIGYIRRGIQGRVVIAHHWDIAAVYEQLWNQSPEDHEVGANTASRVRAFAKRSGWKRPADLDDDRIDWPTAA